ncbi:Ankyrin repeat-containing domain [Trinorchestia longiramus]|nr:Ankyrin repeat-containing domain [Trinorchestia longiramus]
MKQSLTSEAIWLQSTAGTPEWLHEFNRNRTILKDRYKMEAPARQVADEEVVAHGISRSGIRRERHDTLESQASSVDFSDESTESDYFSDSGSYGTSPPILDQEFRRTMRDQIAASLRRHNIRHSKSSDSLSDDDGDDNREIAPPVLQRSTTFERVLSDAIVHQSPLDELKVILEAGAKLIDPIARRPNPLHYTVWQRYPEAAQLLLEQGYDVNALDDFSYSALHLAARHGYTEMIQLLISHGAKVNFNSPQPHEKFPLDAIEEPLRLALKYSHKEAVKLLLDNGADPNGRYFLGSEINLVSPLRPELIELLLESGADVNAQDRNGLTPIMKASRLRQGMESLLLLLSYGGDVNIRADARRADINSSTSLVGSVLHMACSEKVHNRLEVIELLLSRGADPNIVVPGLDGSPILPPLGDYLAATDEHDINVINLLLKYGAEVIIKSPQTSPLGLLGCLSSLREHPLVFEELLEGAQQFDLNLIRHTSLLGTEQRRLCLEVAGSPLSLRHISRICLRHDSATARPESVLKMQLPSIISKYLLYEIS